MDKSPPKLISSLLKKLCDPYLYEGIIGDLEELYAFDCQKSVQKAKVKFLLRALPFFQFTFLKKGLKLKINLEPMLKNYLNITLRSLKKHKVFAFINIFGLAIGMAAGFMILQYVTFESSYDSFIENNENLYRVQTNRYEQGVLNTQWASGSAGAGHLLKEEFPEVEEFTILRSNSDMVVDNGRYFKPKFAYYASETFFKMFSIPLQRGIDSLVLNEPYTAVLSVQFAKSIFGDEDPVGKTIRINDQVGVKITGVFEDIPENSHMKFDILYSFQTYLSIIEEERLVQLDWDGFTNYVRLSPGTNPKILEAKFPPVIANVIEEELIPNEQLRLEYELQPVKDIHLTSNFRGEIKPTGDQETTFFLTIIGFFILVIAWINYINLTTAGSLKRAKEVGIRKVLGSHKKQLIKQFMFESAFMNVVSIMIAAIIVMLTMPYFNNFLERSVEYSFPTQSWFWIGLTSIFIFGIFFSGFYPALVLSSFKPISILKGSFSKSQKGNNLRKGLVVFQYLASIVLITGTYVVYQQLQYLQNQDLGVNIEETLVIEPPKEANDSTYANKYEIFRNELTKKASILQVSSSSSIPGESPDWNAGGIRLLKQEESNQFRVIGCDDQYVDFYGLEIIAGRGFDDSFGNESQSVLVNEAALPLLGIQEMNEVINEKMYFWGDTFKVVGVVKNYRQESPKKAFDGYIFRYGKAWRSYYSAKIKTNNMTAEIKEIENIWLKTYGNQPFDFYFLDDYYQKQYTSESKFGFIFGFFSILAILVACLGLFGLASFMTSIRIKEVSVRKVLGASFTSLWTLMTKDFLKLVGVSILISLPVSWYLMSNWLENFASRINLSWHLFLIPAIMLIIVSILTVSYHTIKTALMNPASCLKDE